MALLVAPSVASADTTVTDCDGASIQAALDAGGVVTLDCDGQTIFLDDTLSITQDAELVGVGDVTLDGDDNVRVIEVAQGVTATIRNLTIEDGDEVVLGGGIANEGTLTVVSSFLVDNEAEAGGAIFNSGDLTLLNSTLANNEAFDGAGGAIRNIGTMSIVNSTIDLNESSDGGGGIINNGTLDLIRSTVSDNYADNNSGGGLNNGGDGVLRVINSTISGNFTDDDGGAIANRGDLTVINSTISGNEADETGGGILNTKDSAATLTNTILVDNSDDDFNDECSGKGFASGGYNIVDDFSCDFGNTGDQEDVLASDVALGPLQDNGGPTETMLPGDTSIAIDAGDDAVCSGEDVGSVDQRGFLRPVGASCDVGAVEVGASAPSVDRIAVVRQACGTDSATGYCLEWIIGLDTGNASLAGAEVTATLTLPDGSSQTVTGTVGRYGATIITPVDAYGTYTLTVTGASTNGAPVALDGGATRSITIGSRFRR